LQAEQAERAMATYGKVAEIRYGRIKEQEEKLKMQQLETRRLETQSDSAMIKEEVDAEDIAESVAHVGQEFL
jgi:ATP-dependent Clp protease ATP-binding subunit ClpB